MEVTENEPQEVQKVGEVLVVEEAEQIVLILKYDQNGVVSETQSFTEENKAE